jgi:hypothetical protein
VCVCVWVGSCVCLWGGGVLCACQEGVMIWGNVDMHVRGWARKGVPCSFACSDKNGCRWWHWAAVEICSKGHPKNL